MSALVTGSVCAALAALVTAGSAAPAGAAPRTEAHVLAKVGSYPDVVTTDQGISLVMWASGEDRTRLEWAVKRPGKPWTDPKVKGDWAGEPSTHGRPQLTTSSGHRVTATWLDGDRRVVVEDWSPAHGWSKPVHLSNGRHTAWNPLIVSNEDGKVAVSWTSQKVGFSNPLFAEAAVRRDGSWQITRLGHKKTRGFPGDRVNLGMAADGAVSAAWEDVGRDFHPEILARRLPADTWTWEPTHDFGNLAGEYFDYAPIALAVQPDGSEMLGRPIASSHEQGVFTRVGQEGWVDQGPQQAMLGPSLTTPSGALVSYTWQSVFLDPDGIAGPASFTEIGYPDGGGWPFATSSNDLVATNGRGHHVVFSTRPDGGTWSDPEVVYTDPDRWIVEDSTHPDMTPDGQVTVLLGTRPAGSARHHPLDLEVVRFDATP